MDISSYVGPAIRLLREKALVSQEELAGRAELDRTYVSGIERGRRNPSVKSLQRVANALGVSLEVIFIQARALADQAEGEQRTMREKLIIRHRSRA
ncbi:helix-turn-helix domain-containing protein [Cognatiluteimonas telluris]|uniref:helix-turn-helix domain-containing protein n=1 Tax=Cognatiluteimonas telluris TaxID=1104775 RepID=UPI00140D6C9B|nr:helix-turn-helix transcriptional regulator [Lysobacter telluris]